jgi:lipopolysaccharide/colanic/teichoic acid biosynthesis glycosyltransferase
MILPSLLVVYVIVKLISKGPAFYRQEFVGRGGRRFHQLNFLTMEANSAGKFLRKYGLTELPVLLNIIRGELAFIGPMPISPDVAECMGEVFPDFKLRFTVKPGIMGWFQVTHTKHTPEEMVELDLYYVQNKSLRLDLEILRRRIFTKAH